MALSGTLETFSLPDVLRLLASTKKTGLLTLEGDRGTGRVWVDDGEIVAADSDRASGEVDGVVFDLLRFEDGSFEFAADAVPAEDDVTRRDVDGALEAAGALLEEWREIESVVPSLDVWVRLVPEIDGDVTIGTDQWRVLAHIGTGASGHRIAGELEQGELDVCRQLKDLIDGGLVELDETAPDAGDSGESARNDLPAFQPPAFAASTIGSSDWTPPEPLGPDAVTEDPWGPDAEVDASADVDRGVDDDVDLAVDAELEETVAGSEAGTAFDDEEAVQDEEHVAELTVEVPVDEAVDEAGDAELDQLQELEQVAEDEDDPDAFLSQLAHLSPKAAAAIEATANEDVRGSVEDPAGGLDGGLDAGDEAPQSTSGDFLSSLVPGAEPADPDLAAPAAEASVAPDATAHAESDDDISQNLLLRFLSSTKQ